MPIEFNGYVYERKDWMKLASAIKQTDPEYISWDNAQERAKNLLECKPVGSKHCPHPSYLMAGIPIKHARKYDIPLFLENAYEDYTKGIKKSTKVNRSEPIIKKRGLFSRATKMIGISNKRNHLPLKDYSYAKYSPWKLLEAEHNQYVDIYDTYGNVDFVNVFPDQGFAYVADTVGHNYKKKGQINKYEQISTLWGQFDELVPEQLNEEYDAETKANNLYKLIEKIHMQFEIFGKSSTFASITLSQDDPNVYIMGIGDSFIIVVPVSPKGITEPAQILSGEGTNTALTTQGATAGELGSTIKNAQQVNWPLPKKDVYLMLITDGVFNVLTNPDLTFERKNTANSLNVLQSLVQETVDQGFDAEYLRDRIIETSMESYNKNGPFEGSSGKISEKDFDDCSVAVIYIPYI